MNYFYARISDEKLSYENQLIEFDRYSKFNKINIDIIIKDVSDGFENKKGNRLFDLLNDMNDNDTIYAYNLSRISRRASRLRQFYDLIKLKRVNVVFLLNSDEELIIKETPMELCVILSNISEIDTEYISIVAKNALNNLKEQGIKLGRPPKYDSEMINKVVELYKSGKTRLEIAEELNIPYLSVWRLINDHDKNIESEETYINIPLEMKLEIWGDMKMGKNNEELAKQYHLDVETIESILKSLKGGAHW